MADHSSPGGAESRDWKSRFGYQIHAWHDSDRAGRSSQSHRQVGREKIGRENFGRQAGAERLTDGRLTDGRRMEDGR